MFNFKDWIKTFQAEREGCGELKMTYEAALPDRETLTDQMRNNDRASVASISDKDIKMLEWGKRQYEKYLYRQATKRITDTFLLSGHDLSVFKDEEIENAICEFRNMMQDAGVTVNEAWQAFNAARAQNSREF